MTLKLVLMTGIAVLSLACMLGALAYFAVVFKLGLEQSIAVYGFDFTAWGGAIAFAGIWSTLYWLSRPERQS